MQQHTLSVPRLTIGLDVSDHCSNFCVLDAGGTVVEEGRLATAPAALRRRFGTMPRARIVLEAGTHSPWIGRLLSDCGHELIVSNPRRLELIARSDSKSDRRDAECLARIGRLDPALLKPVQHRAESAQADLALLRARDALVAARTQLVNHVRGAVKSAGGRLPACSTPSFPRAAAAHLPELLRSALAPVLATLEQLTRTIRTYDREIRLRAATRYPEAAALEQVSGVGTLTALCYVLTIEDPARFRTARQVGSYLGLRPKQRDSGTSRPGLRITKAGDALLRRLLVSSAHYILGPFGPDTDLRRWGLALAARGGAAGKKRAVVAVARLSSGPAASAVDDRRALRAAPHRPAARGSDCVNTPRGRPE